MAHTDSYRTFFVRSRGRVSGPFGVVELVRMVHRGAVSRAHEISSDATHWIAAGDCAELFNGPVRLVGANDDAELTPTDGSTAVESPSAGEKMFYRQSGEAYGPMPLAIVKSLIDGGRLGADDLVWEEGSPQSYPAASHPLLAAVASPRPVGHHMHHPTAAAGSFSGFAIGLFACIGVLIVFGFGGAIWLSSDRNPAGPQATSGAPAALDDTQPTGSEGRLPGAADSSPVIASANDEALVAQAVGFVVVGATTSKTGHRTLEFPDSSGSCFAVSPQGHLISNRHVIEQFQEWIDDHTLADELMRDYGITFTPRIWIFFGGVKFDAKLLYADAKDDICVLKVERHQPYFRLNSGTSTARNDEVFALGFPAIAMEPLSLEESRKRIADSEHFKPDIREYFKTSDFEYTLTHGALSRSITKEDGTRWIQHEAVIRHGNSGGPLVTKSGVVIGINTRLQKNKENDVQVNNSLDISQFQSRLDKVIPHISWQ